jgi:hypothetical protein
MVKVQVEHVWGLNLDQEVQETFMVAEFLTFSPSEMSFWASSANNSALPNRPLWGNIVVALVSLVISGDGAMA